MDITPQTLLKKYGSQAEIAKALQVTPGAVWQWFRAGKIPELRQYQLRDRLAARDRAESTNAPSQSTG